MGYKTVVRPFCEKVHSNPSYVAHLKLFLRTAHAGVMLHIEGLEISRRFASSSSILSFFDPRVMRFVLKFRDLFSLNSDNEKKYQILIRNYVRIVSS